MGNQKKNLHQVQSLAVILIRVHSICMYLYMNVFVCVNGMSTHWTLSARNVIVDDCMTSFHS